MNQRYDIQENRIRRGGRGIPRMMVALLVFLLGTPFTAMAQVSAVKTQLDVTVFIEDSLGQSNIPGAKVVLSGPTPQEAVTNEEGKCSFLDLAPGTYTVRAESPGLESLEDVTVTVTAGAAAQISLKLKPSAVTSTVTVTAADQSIEASSTSNQTIASTTVTQAPNQNERTESLLPLIPGVVRGPDGHINLKGARNTQSGALVNSANVTDPATGGPAFDVPIDVVASVQVISNPYDPQYGRLTGAISLIDTKPSNYETFKFSVKNVLPRARKRDGDIVGIESATPRIMITGPLIRDRLALTQTLEYRYVRTPVNSLPSMERDTTLEAVNSYTQGDLILTPLQTATISLAIYPQKLRNMGLNTFTPQPSTPDYHQRGYQFYAQHRYIFGQASMLTSQVSYKTFDADITRNDTDPYMLLVETTEGGFFNQQKRRSERFDIQETYQFTPVQFWGTHQLKAGFNYAYSTYDGTQSFQSAEIQDVSGGAIERITFDRPGFASIEQHETAGYVSDEWKPFSRLLLYAGVRLDRDSITDSIHTAPRGGFQLALTSDGKTLLKGGGGLFYDRVPLMVSAFPSLPDRTVVLLNSAGQVLSSTQLDNQITGELRNPRSTAWNVAVSREVLEGLQVEIGFERRTTTRDFLVAPEPGTGFSVLSLSNTGGQSYRELQITGRYRFRGHVLNASYVRSRAYGDLNDFFQFFGNVPKVVVQSNDQGRLNFDAPNRMLLWGEFAAPWKIRILPVYDLHTGFPYSVQDVYRQYVGPRNSRRFPRFSALDIQFLRPFRIPIGHKHLKGTAGLSVFNVFNRFNPREAQTIVESPRFGQFFNSVPREFRAKFVLEF